MPPMAKHGKNASASSVYSYAERKKDERESGYGVLHERLGADSIREFDCCSLSLQPCANPLISKEGYLFDKEALLTYILDQKKEIKRRMKEWHKQEERDADEVEDVKRRKRDREIAVFSAVEGTPAHVGTFDKVEDQLINAEELSRRDRPSAADGGRTWESKDNKPTSVSNMSGGRKRTCPSFWLPGEQDMETKTRMLKPEERVLCPMTGKPLRLKDMLPVKFTRMPSDSKNSLEGLKTRYMCPVTRDTLTNTTACAVLTQTGDVITKECVDKIIKKDWRHPLTGEEMTENDIIYMQRGGTGFASVNKKDLDAQLTRPTMAIQ